MGLAIAFKYKYYCQLKYHYSNICLIWSKLNNFIVNIILLATKSFNNLMVLCSQ